MRLLTAIKAFWSVLVSASVAARVEQALDSTKQNQQVESLTDQPAEPSRNVGQIDSAPARSDAITLLAALQREARFLDIVQEPLAEYDDAQVGAAARDVLRDCGSVIERMFAVQPLVEDEEGADIEIPQGFDTGCYRLTGNVSGEPPFRGQLAHHGWQTTRCDLPHWSGSEESARVVAPAEVEVA